MNSIDEKYYQSYQNRLIVWETGKKKAAGASRLVKLYIYFNLIIGVPFTWFSSFNSFTKANSAIEVEALAFSTLVVLSFALILTLISLYFEVSYFQRILKQKDIIKELPDHNKNIIKILINDLCTSMKIDIGSINFWINYRSYDFSPSIVEYKGKVHLILPLAFFKICSAHQQEAKAILAHELAHISQKDSNLWLLASAYVRSIMEILFPTNIGIMLTSLAVNFQITNEYTQESLSESVILFLVIAAGTAIAGSIVTLPMYLFLRHIRRMRHRSEYLADLAATIFASREHLCKALERYNFTKNEDKGNFFSVHPTLDNRMKQITR